MGNHLSRAIIDFAATKRCNKRDFICFTENCFIRKDSKDGLRNEGKICRLYYSKNYRSESIEKIIEYQKNYY